MNTTLQRLKAATRSIGAVTFLLLGSGAIGTASAMTITLDDPNQTVVRPDIGTTRVNYTGHIEIDEGMSLDLFSLDALYTASGDLISGAFPQLTFLTDGILFYFDVSASEVLGLYAYDFAVHPVNFTAYECPIGGGQCAGASATYSLNVVAAAVPEPALLTLSAFGLAGLLATRRLRATNPA